MILKGEGSIEFEGGQIEYKLGDSILIPNKISGIKIKPESESKVLEVLIPT
jgi:ethanolamine utilization protein EutQ (cupin superfamily)